MLNIEGATQLHNARISDHGARQVLGMNGSINSYINTGNPYQSYSLPNDEFVKEGSTKSKLHKALDVLAYGTAIGVGIFACIKNKGKISEVINKYSGKLKEGLNKIDFSKLKPKAKDGQKVTNKVADGKLKNLLSGLKNIKSIWVAPRY